MLNILYTIIEVIAFVSWQFLKLAGLSVILAFFQFIQVALYAISFVLLAIFGPIYLSYYAITHNPIFIALGHMSYSALTLAVSIISPLLVPLAVAGAIFTLYRYYVQYKIDNNPAKLALLAAKKAANAALLEACKNGNYQAAKDALKKGADPNFTAEQSGGATPLHLACDYCLSDVEDKPYGPRLMLIRLLLKKGANPWQNNVHGLNPFHVAVENQFYLAFEEFNHLPKSDISIFNKPTAQGITPLMLLVHQFKQNDITSSLERLIELGADPNLISATENLEKGTPLVIFAYQFLEPPRCYRPDKVHFFQENYLYFLEHGANPVVPMLKGAYQRSLYGSMSPILLALEAQSVPGLVYLKQWVRLQVMTSPYYTGEKFNPQRWGKVSSEQELARVFSKATIFKNTYKLENVYVQLADTFLEHQNMAGLSYLLEKITPSDTGYAHLQCIFAQQYLSSLAEVDKTEQAEYRKLVIEFCLKGLNSQENTSVHKQETLIQLNLLLPKLLHEWTGGKSPLSLNSEKPGEDVYGWLAQKLLNEPLPKQPTILPGYHSSKSAASVAVNDPYSELLNAKLNYVPRTLKT